MDTVATVLGLQHNPVLQRGRVQRHRRAAVSDDTVPLGAAASAVPFNAFGAVLLLRLLMHHAAGTPQVCDISFAYLLIAHVSVWRLCRLGSDEESVSSSTDSETEAPSRRDKRRRQERKRQRFLESSTYAAQQAMEKVLAGVPLLQQLQPEAALAEERAVALYEGDSSNSEEEEEAKQRQKTEATEAAAVDPLGKLLLQLDEEAGSQTDEDTTAAAAADGESAGTSAARALILARKQRLLSLRLQLNQGRAMNTKEVGKRDNRHMHATAEAAPTPAASAVAAVCM